MLPPEKTRQIGALVFSVRHGAGVPPEDTWLKESL